MQLKNNTILITGGTSGFGFEFAARLTELGNTVIITGRNAQELIETKQKIPAVHTIVSDVSKPEDTVKLFDLVVHRFPNLNILINYAGEMRKFSLHQAHDLTDLTREIEINLVGPIRLVQQFLAHLKRQKNAVILNVTSGTPEKIVDAAIRGMKNDKDEIYPGLAKLIRAMSRIAPRFLVKQAGKMGASYMYGRK